jgi:hypothetical protein
LTLIETVKSLFKTGAKPTGQDFALWIDNSVNVVTDLKSTEIKDNNGVYTGFKFNRIRFGRVFSYWISKDQNYTPSEAVMLDAGTEIASLTDYPELELYKGDQMTVIGFLTTGSDEMIMAMVAIDNNGIAISRLNGLEISIDIPSWSFDKLLVLGDQD